MARAFPDPDVTAALAPFARVAVDFAAARPVADRLAANWTPTLCFLDPDGRERHRLVGWHPAPELAAQARLALGKIRFGQGRWADAEALLAEVTAQHGATDAAPEAQYWIGAARYQRERKPDGIRAAWQDVVRRWPGSPWAIRANSPKPPPVA